MADTALLVVDVQPALLTGAHDMDAWLSRIAGLAERARSAGVPVFYLRQRLDVPAETADVHPAAAPRAGEVVLDKDSADAFLGTTLDDLLRGRSVRRVVVTGYATEFCVDSTCRGALTRGYDLVLVADGHTTPDRPAGAVPTAPQIIAHHNATFAVIRYAGRSIAVTPAARVRFDEQPG